LQPNFFKDVYFFSNTSGRSVFGALAPEHWGALFLQKIFKNSFNAHMKKTLLIVRHAHTFDPNPGQEDHQRELTPEGKAEARHAAEWLKEEGNLPKKIVASFAIRTRQTASILAEILLGDPIAYESETELYRASEHELCDFIKHNFTNEEIIMLVGHNPAVTQLAIRLGATTISYLPPVSIVILSFEINDWSELSWHSGKLIDKRLTDEN